MKITKIIFLKDWSNYIKGDILEEKNGKFIFKNYERKEYFSILKHKDILFLINANIVEIKEIESVLHKK